MDWTNVLVGGLACIGTIIGSLAGIKQSNKVVDIRLQSLETKVDKHNNLVERMAITETRLDIIERGMTYEHSN